MVSYKLLTNKCDWIFETLILGFQLTSQSKKVAHKNSISVIYVHVPYTKNKIFMRHLVKKNTHK